MITDRQEAAYGCGQLWPCAERLVMQMNELTTKPTGLEAFVKGIVVRTGSHFRDCELLLANNADRHLSSVFVLLRVLMDDIMRMSYIHARVDGQQEIDMLTSEAYKNWYKTWDTAALINEAHCSDGVPTRIMVEGQKCLFLYNLENRTLVEEKLDGTFRFRKKVEMDEMFRVIRANPRVSEFARAYVLFRHWSHYVHYSMLTYKLDHDPHLRAKEVQWLDETVYLGYKLLRLANEMVAECNPQVVWTPSEIDQYLDRPGYVIGR